MILLILESSIRLPIDLTGSEFPDIYILAEIFIQLISLLLQNFNKTMGLSSTLENIWNSFSDPPKSQHKKQSRQF